MFPCGITLLNFILSQQTKNTYYLRPTLYSQTYYVPKFSSSKTILTLQIKGGYNCVQYYKERLDFKIFCSPEWGGDTEILLQLYSSLIRSRLDYACQVYGSAKPSYLKMLDPIQNQGLRLAMGAYRTSPETSLQVEANMPPLDLRRK